MLDSLSSATGDTQAPIFVYVAPSLPPFHYGNGNGLLFHMTQPTSRSTIKAIVCSKPTIRGKLEQMKTQWHNS